MNNQTEDKAEKRLRDAEGFIDPEKAFGWNRWGIIAAIYFWSMMAAPLGYLCRTDYWSPEAFVCRYHVFDVAFAIPYLFSMGMVTFFGVKAFKAGDKKEFRSFLFAFASQCFWGFWILVASLN